jgi:hypothetical protein
LYQNWEINKIKIILREKNRCRFLPSTFVAHRKHNRSPVKLKKIHNDEGVSKKKNGQKSAWPFEPLGGTCEMGILILGQDKQIYLSGTLHETHFFQGGGSC